MASWPIWKTIASGKFHYHMTVQRSRPSRLTADAARTRKTQNNICSHVGWWHGSTVYGVNATWSILPTLSDVMDFLTYIKTKSTNRTAAKVHFCNCTRSPAVGGKLHCRVTVPRSNLLTLHDLVNPNNNVGWCTSARSMSQSTTVLESWKVPLSHDSTEV